MRFLWTTDDMIRAMHGRPVGQLPAGITGISIDSRSIAEGEAFFAIKGDRVDKDALRVIYRSAKFPTSSFGVSSQLCPELAKKIMDVPTEAIKEPEAPVKK